VHDINVQTTRVDEWHSCLIHTNLWKTHFAWLLLSNHDPLSLWWMKILAMEKNVILILIIIMPKMCWHNNGGKFVMFIHHQLKVNFEFHSSTKNIRKLSISLDTNYFEMLIVVLMVYINRSLLSIEPYIKGSSTTLNIKNL
jgi:hypothetical protein